VTYKKSLSVSLRVLKKKGGGPSPGAIVGKKKQKEKGKRIIGQKVCRDEISKGRDRGKSSASSVCKREKGKGFRQQLTKERDSLTPGKKKRLERYRFSAGKAKRSSTYLTEKKKGLRHATEPCRGESHTKK